MNRCAVCLIMASKDGRRRFKKLGDVPVRRNTTRQTRFPPPRRSSFQRERKSRRLIGSRLTTLSLAPLLHLLLFSVSGPFFFFFPHLFPVFYRDSERREQCFLLSLLMSFPLCRQSNFHLSVARTGRWGGGAGGESKREQSKANGGAALLMRFPFPLSRYTG